ncbi:transporter, partial [Mycobacterium tuberculosis]|nr:transporter [Mycobacterium tuberculosis]
RLTYEVNGQLKVFVDGEGAGVTFSDIDIGEHERAHSGGRWRVGGGVIYQATDQHQFILQSHWTDKDAHNNAYAYDVRDIE